MKNNIKRQNMIRQGIIVFFRTILIIGLSFVILYPLIESIIPAITHYNYLGRPNSIWIPQKTGLLSFQMSAHLLNYVPSLTKTLIYVTSTMAIQLFVSAIVGYGFSKLTFKGNNILFAMVLLTIIVPPQIIMLPQFFHFKDFDILGIFKLIKGEPINLLGNTYVLYLMSFLGMGLRSGLFIFLFRQFYRGLPKELEEAATIDGCGFFRTFFQIILPNTKTMMITIGVFAFVWNYGDIFYTGLFGAGADSGNGLLAILLNERFRESYTISNAFKDLTNQPAGTEAPQLLLGATVGAGRLMFITPLLILYFIIQRKFVQSFERSGIVG